MWECAGSERMSSCCSPLAPPTVRDSCLAGASACVFTAAGQLRVCPHSTVGEHVSSSTGRAIHRPQQLQFLAATPPGPIKVTKERKKI